MRDENDVRALQRQPGRAAGLTALAVLLLAAGLPALGEVAGHAGTTGTAASCCRPDAEAEKTATTRSVVSEPVDLDLPDVTLVRMDGAKVSLRDELVGDRPVMVNFIFTTCTTICPVMSATFQQVQENLGERRDRVRMISISIDPEHDTPATLAAYARRHNAGPEWHFLTGQPATIERVQRAFGAYRGSKFNHEPLTFLRGADDTRWLRVAGLRSARDLDTALQGAMAGL